MYDVFGGLGSREVVGGAECRGTRIQARIVNVAGTAVSHLAVFVGGIRARRVVHSFVTVKSWQIEGKSSGTHQGMNCRTMCKSKVGQYWKESCGTSQGFRDTTHGLPFFVSIFWAHRSRAPRLLKKASPRENLAVEDFSVKNLTACTGELGHKDVCLVPDPPIKPMRPAQRSGACVLGFELNQQAASLKQNDEEVHTVRRSGTFCTGKSAQLVQVFMGEFKSM